MRTRLVELDQIVQPLVIEGVEVFKESSLVKLDEFLLDRGIFAWRSGAIARPPWAPYGRLPAARTVLAPKVRAAPCLLFPAVLTCWCADRPRSPMPFAPLHTHAAQLDTLIR